MKSRNQILLGRKIRKMVKEELDDAIRVGDKVTFTVPYHNTKLKFQGEVISKSHAYCKVKYKTGGHTLETEVPINWCTKEK